MDFKSTARISNAGNLSKPDILSIRRFPQFWGDLKGGGNFLPLAPRFRGYIEIMEKSGERKIAHSDFFICAQKTR